MGDIHASAQRTVAHLGRINENQLEISRALAANSAALREFARGDLIPIIQEHISHAMKTREEPGSNGNGSTSHDETCNLPHYNAVTA